MVETPQLCVGRHDLGLVECGGFGGLSEMRKECRLRGLGLGCGGWRAVRVAVRERGGPQSLQFLLLPQER